MKNKIQATIIFCGFFLTCLFTSCEDIQQEEEFELTGNVSQYFPSYCVNLEGSYSWGSDNHFQMTMKPNFYFDPSEWGLKIDKVKYYIDDVYYKTETQSPYKIEYESKNWEAGAHNLRADITISGEKIETFVLQCTKSLNTSSSAAKALDVWFDYNYATIGEDFCLTAHLNESRSSEGSKIKSFTSKWDDTSMGQTTSAPYKLTHKVTEAPGTKHNIKASLQCVQGNSTVTYGYSRSGYEIPGPNDVMQTFIVKSRYSDYKNGECFQGIARQFIGKEVKGTYEFKLYLDGLLIASSKTFPYEVSYIIKNQSVGNHKLKKQWVRYDEEGKITNAYSTDDFITITQ